MRKRCIVLLGALYNICTLTHAYSISLDTDLFHPPSPMCFACIYARIYAFCLDRIEEELVDKRGQGVKTEKKEEKDERNSMYNTHIICTCIRRGKDAWLVRKDMIVLRAMTRTHTVYE